MENTKTILLYNITPNELKEMIIADLKIELESILLKINKPENYSVQKAAETFSSTARKVRNFDISFSPISLGCILL